MIVLPERAQLAKPVEFSESILHALDTFYAIASVAHWQNPFAVKQTFPTAIILKNERMILDIENQYQGMITVTVPVIEDQLDYEAVLHRIDELFDAKPGTAEAYELEILVLLADSYQKKAHPLPKVSPVEVIKFIMQQRGLMQKDIAPYFGGKNRVLEVMRGERKLTLQMIKKISAGLHIPVKALI